MQLYKKLYNICIKGWTIYGTIHTPLSGNGTDQSKTNAKAKAQLWHKMVLIKTRIVKQEAERLTGWGLNSPDPCQLRLYRAQ